MNKLQVRPRRSLLDWSYAEIKKKNTTSHPLDEQKLSKYNKVGIELPPSSKHMRVPGGS